MPLTARPARPEDALAITEIHNQGIADRIATFETEPRAVSDIQQGFSHARAFVSVTDHAGEVVGYAVAHDPPLGRFAALADRAPHAGSNEASP